MALTTLFREDGVHVHHAVYGHIATIRRDIHGNVWLIDDLDNTISFPFATEYASLKAAEYSLLAFTYELAATGH